MDIRRFREKIWGYYRLHKRDFPWRRTKNPYHILVSEVMLQQTQVARVVPKYKFFLKKFPTIQAIARASLRDVLRAWQGLGYNRRALSLKKSAEMVLKRFGGKVPSDSRLLNSLPGVGEGTAGAIRAFAFNKPVVFIETNIRRVYIYFFFKNRRKVSDKEILPLVEEALDRKNPREWYWALMDYGARLRRGYGGQAILNPNRKSAHYAKQAKFTGSKRELRGKILKLLVQRKSGTITQIAKTTLWPRSEVLGALRELEGEGFVVVKGGKVSILTK